MTATWALPNQILLLSLTTAPAPMAVALAKSPVCCELEGEQARLTRESGVQVVLAAHLEAVQKESFYESLFNDSLATCRWLPQ